MQFGANQKLKFNAPIGSYSIVTAREHYDSQITATDSEAELLINFFGRENIHIGNVASNQLKATKSFKLYPDGNEINLNCGCTYLQKLDLNLNLIQSGLCLKKIALYGLAVCKKLHGGMKISLLFTTRPKALIKIHLRN
jgi:hypothetical protein